MKALVMPAEETLNSNADATGERDVQYTDAKSTLILPFSIFSSSIGGGYRTAYSSQFKIDFANMHEDKYGRQAEIPLQGPFTEKHVGGMQHRHIEINRGTDTRSTRPEAWHLESFLTDTSVVYYIQEFFKDAPTTGTTDVGVLSLPIGSTTGDPSEYEYWRNGGESSDNSWTFFSGSTPTAGTGPVSGSNDWTNSGYAYCEVLPSKVGQTFGLTTPLIDFLEATDSQEAYSTILSFAYHMHGSGIGTLKVEASQDKTFSDVNIIENLFTISGEQHPHPVSYPWTTKILYLNQYKNKRFYIRFLYTAGVTHLSDCAIDNINIYSGANVRKNSFKLLRKLS